ncbi:RNA polymerase sigma factor [Cytobacillus dafuensis]|uniref:RNA polymerase sigma factor n=1 Tax=Cytobacillus dafuensis TaxID=1742359 RepID=UPI00070C993F|nr:sigma-70 family RNA polymerase sigma factor [Cytobacillus dafuensis]
MYVNRTECSIEELNENSFEDLIKQYHQQIYIYCYNILRNPHDAEDAAQEVFMKAYQSNRVEEINNHSAWLYKIAYNHCLNKIRRKTLIEFIPFTEKNRLKREVYHDQQSDFELNYILSNLKPKERAIIVLRIIEDKDFAEIATILDTSIPTARKRFERVKSKIQKLIERRIQDER